RPAPLRRGRSHPNRRLRKSDCPWCRQRIRPSRWSRREWRERWLPRPKNNPHRMSLFPSSCLHHETGFDKAQTTARSSRAERSEVEGPRRTRERGRSQLLRGPSTSLGMTDFLLPPLHHHAAIDGEYLAGDVLRFRGSEICDGRSDVVGLAQFAERNFLQDGLTHFVGKHAGHIRLEIGRASCRERV